MTSRDFCYWLQGYFELVKLEFDEGHALTLRPKVTAAIQNHLNMVFKHEIDPSFGSEKVQKELQKIHAGGVVDHETRFNC